MPAEKDPAPAPEPASEKMPKVLGTSTVGAGDNMTDEQDPEHHDSAFDEMDMVVHVAKNHTPPCFFARDAFRALSEEGLTKLPPDDRFKLAYHNSTQQWHARWNSELAGDPKNYAPSWGSVRSETSALLLALIQLWTWYLTTVDEDSEGQKHLKMLQMHSDKIPF